MISGLIFGTLYLNLLLRPKHTVDSGPQVVNLHVKSCSNEIPALQTVLVVNAQHEGGPFPGSKEKGRSKEQPNLAHIWGTQKINRQCKLVPWKRCESILSSQRFPEKNKQGKQEIWWGGSCCTCLVLFSEGLNPNKKTPNTVDG